MPTGCRAGRHGCGGEAIRRGDAPRDKRPHEFQLLLGGDVEDGAEETFGEGRCYSCSNLCYNAFRGFCYRSHESCSNGCPSVIPIFFSIAYCDTLTSAPTKSLPELRLSPACSQLPPHKFRIVDEGGRNHGLGRVVSWHIWASPTRPGSFSKSAFSSTPSLVCRMRAHPRPCSRRHGASRPRKRRSSSGRGCMTSAMLLSASSRAPKCENGQPSQDENGSAAPGLVLVKSSRVMTHEGGESHSAQRRARTAAVCSRRARARPRCRGAAGHGCSRWWAMSHPQDLPELQSTNVSMVACHPPTWPRAPMSTDTRADDIHCSASARWRAATISAPR